MRPSKKRGEDSCDWDVFNWKMFHLKFYSSIHRYNLKVVSIELVITLVFLDDNRNTEVQVGR